MDRRSMNNSARADSSGWIWQLMILLQRWSCPRRTCCICASSLRQAPCVSLPLTPSSPQSRLIAKLKVTRLTFGPSVVSIGIFNVSGIRVIDLLRLNRRNILVDWIDRLSELNWDWLILLMTGDSKCLPSEFDCEDAVCIDSSLRCNGRINCKFRYDEDNCQVSTPSKDSLLDSSRILANSESFSYKFPFDL